ncbi:hypothetical protein OHR68_03590 [Spirillospora sp. NBC_00431]
MTSTLRALFYGTACTLARRVLTVARSPLRLAACVAAVAAFVVLQDRSGGGDLAGPLLTTGRLPYAAAGLAALQGALGALAAFRCPIRLTPADVAWVLPAPDGPRALVCHRLVSMFGGFLAAGCAGGLAGWAAAGRGPGALGAALALTLAATLLRSTAYVSFVLVTRGVPRAVPAVVWGVLGTVSVALAVARGFGHDGDTWWPPSVLLEGLLTPLAGGQDAAGWTATAVTAALVAALGLTAVMLADRYHDDAARLAWEFAALRAAVRSGDTGGPAARMAARRLRRGVASLTAGGRFAGEAAFAWRALAQLRRTWRRDLASTVPLMAAAAAAAIWAEPAAAAVPWGVAAVLALLGAASTGLADEVDRTFFRAIPGRLGRQVLAMEAVPFAMTAATLTLVWLPSAVLAPDMSAGARAGGVASSVGLAAVVACACSAGAARARSVSPRLGIALAGAAAAVLAAAAAQSLTVPDGPRPGFVFAGVCCGGAAVLHGAAVRVLGQVLDPGTGR